MFRHTFLRNYKAYKVETWYTHGQWVDVSWIQESDCSCLIIPLFFHFSLQFSNLKIFRHTFLRNCEAYKVETRYWNRAAAAYLSLYFFIFLSLQFSNINVKQFRTFLRNCEAYKVETWYTHGQSVDVSCIPKSSYCSYLSLYFFIFLSNFISIKDFSGMTAPWIF